MYDIFFISFFEPNAEKNWRKLKKRFPLAKRILNVDGIHNAHVAAAKKSLTKMFWVVDADAEIVDDFDFSYKVSEWNLTTVHVWKSRNPVNGLEYGYGGIKLLPKFKTMQVDTSTVDFTTSVSDNFQIIDQVSNVTQFNTDSFNAWKSAFRECAKLASKIITRQNDEETEHRLNVWCTQGAENAFGKDTIMGAIAGKNFANSHSQDLAKINNWAWLQHEFSKTKNS